MTTMTNIQWNGNEGIVEASEIGFAPGVWPLTIEVVRDGEPTTLLRSLYYRTTLAAIGSVMYGRSDGKYSLTVLND